VSQGSTFPEIRPWRECPFRRGAKYRVLKTFTPMRGAFGTGELLTFDTDTYSRYDGMTGYFFHDTAGIGRVWDVRDEDDIDRWKNIFVEVTEDATNNA
jgi:hypothetical protein